ncbi:MAG TPA: cysteine desulfurase family protein [Gammaproteobacteria bacterium]
MSSMPVYLDHNSTTPLDARVLAAMLPYMQELYGNASSQHRYGRLTSGAIERAREQVAALVGAKPNQLIFTGGGTEANNMALRSICAHNQTGHLAVSAIEHASLREPAFALCEEGWSVDEIPVSRDGVVDPAAVAAIMRTDTRMVSVMLANNETGAVQPVERIAAVVHTRNAVLHTDASQAVGKLPVDFAALGADLMTISAHKFYGPQGIGALVFNRSLNLQPLLRGGGHERGLRAGTPNVAAIVGFGMAAELAAAELAARTQYLSRIRDRIQRALLQHPEVCIFAEKAMRLPNTLQFAVQGYHGETLLLELDRQGFAVSSGSACHSDAHEPSHVLLAMQIEPALALTAIRVSLGMSTKEQDADKFVATLHGILTRFRQTSVRVANI